MFEKSIFSVVATPASSILIRSSKKKKKKKKPLCPVTVLVDSQVSDHCPWATCFDISMTLGQGQEMTLTLINYIPSMTLLLVCI